jgi:hypothetical protein
MKKSKAKSGIYAADKTGLIPADEDSLVSPLKGSKAFKKVADLLTRRKSKPEITEVVSLEKITIGVRILGDTPLVVNQFDQKSIAQMRAVMEGRASTGREPKNPVQEFKDSLYRLPNPEDGFGFPAEAFRAAMITSANDVKQVKAQLKRCIRTMPLNSVFFEVDALVKIIAPSIVEPVTECDKVYKDDIAFEHAHGASMREDVVRLPNGRPDLRYRGQFLNWSAEFSILFNRKGITTEQLMALLDAAGMAGIGEGRPSSPRNPAGQYGCFHVDPGGLRIPPGI